jgi:hypothetical protein
LLLESDAGSKPSRSSSLPAEALIRTLQAATVLHTPDEALERGASLLAPFVKGLELHCVFSQRAVGAPLVPVASGVTTSPDRRIA